AVEGEHDAGGLRALLANEGERLPHGGAGGDHIVDDEHLPAKRRADDIAALAVVLGLLAVEGIGHIAPVMLEERGCRRRGERYALVGRPEEHVESGRRARDGRGVAAAQDGDGLAVAEETGVEEVRALTAGFERELPEAQRLA